MVEIALEYGFAYGARLPDTVYHPVYFVDQNWKEPNRARYMQELAEHRPAMATVLDWEFEEQLPEVLNWTEEAAQYVAEAVVIIPKVIGGIARIPREIGGKRVILGYSVPTRYAGTSVPVWEFYGWPVHLLGGSPHQQIKLWHYLHHQAEVVSLDNNMISSMATRYCQFWTPGTARYARNRFWPTLREANGGKRWGDGSDQADTPYEAFRRSCENVARAWSEL